MTADHTKGDADLAALRGRDDFQEFLWALPAAKR
jgi:hypothetical protein